MYFTKELVQRAIENISFVHPFFGITYLSAKLHELPVGNTTYCSIDTWNKEFMDEFHSIAPASKFYFQPYNSNSRDKQWVNNRYPSTGLQAVNTQTFREAFIHERGSRTWGWDQNYINTLHEYIQRDSHPLPAFYLAVWLLRQDDLDGNLTPSDIIMEFFDRFNIGPDESSELFDIEIPDDLQANLFQEKILDWDDYLSFVSFPPDLMGENSENSPLVDMIEQERKTGGTNIILYGVPGSGKSWTIEHEYCHPGSIVERLVFHPDYTNSDFVGQILPVVDKENDNQVTYEFSPGPFTTILRDAHQNPHQEYILVIEELNRGNAPAIFGDIFQLLDRTTSDKIVDGVKYPIGTSEYEITNKNIAEVVYQDPTHKIRIPSNLSILATMNTSDQNVFTLDTAFQRRWRMRLIENNFENVRSSLANGLILDTEVTWKRFCETINKQIVGNKAKMASSEDKRLGVYFVNERDLEYNSADIPENYDNLVTELNELLKAERDNAITDTQKARLQQIRTALIQNRIFPEKVIKYLWDDAFKFNPGAIFDTEDNKNLDSLEAVIRMFVYECRGKDRFRIFKKSIQDLLYEA